MGISGRRPAFAAFLFATRHNPGLPAKGMAHQFSGLDMVKNWFFLGIAILSEVVATSSLKASDGFSRLWPSLAVVTGYGISFYCLALTLRVIPMGVVYAIWSGIGIVLITLVGWFLFNQKLDLPALLGIGLIAAGVVVMNVFSKSVGH